VFLAKKRDSGRLVALKRIPLDAEDDANDSFTREVDAVRLLNQSDDARAMGIVFIRDSFKTETACWIVQQFVAGGTLAMAIDSAATPFAERRIAWYTLQLVEALAFIHERGIIHHDIKSSNLLVDHEDMPRLILCDFGACAKLGEEGSGFTAEFGAPELVTAGMRLCPPSSPIPLRPLSVCPLLSAHPLIDTLNMLLQQSPVKLQS
jgi:mitogen-activated protein kinase kinase kinase